MKKEYNILEIERELVLAKEKPNPYWFLIESKNNKKFNCLGKFRILLRIIVLQIQR
mgnify:CR=1 FL=1